MQLLLLHIQNYFSHGTVKNWSLSFPHIRLTDGSSETLTSDRSKVKTVYGVAPDIEIWINIIAFILSTLMA